MAIRKKKINRPGPKGPPARDPLLAVPQIMPGIEFKLDDHKLLQIRRPILRENGFSRWLASKLGFIKAFRLNLDEMGTFYWSQINDRNNLRMIAVKLAKKYDIPQKQANETTVEYTQMLMLRGVIGLKLDDEKNSESRER